MRRKYPRSKLLHQGLSTLDLISDQKKRGSSHVHFDILHIKLANGKQKEIYFDISSFYGGRVSALMDPHADIAEKIAELYE